METDQSRIHFNNEPLADLTGSGFQDPEGEDLTAFLLKVVVPAAVGMLILIAALLVALIVVIHLRQRHMFRSKHNVQLISYLTHLFQLVEQQWVKSKLAWQLCIEIEVALFIVCCGLPIFIATVSKFKLFSFFSGQPWGAVAAAVNGIGSLNRCLVSSNMLRKRYL